MPTVKLKILGSRFDLYFSVIFWPVKSCFLSTEDKGWIFTFNGYRYKKSHLQRNTISN